MSAGHLRGTVRGRTIELQDETGLPEGQMVTVVVQPIVDEHEDASPEERFARCFGAWADDAEEIDEYLDWTRQHRKFNK